MQMSQTRLFIFVEGWSDTFFYSSLAALHCNPGGLRYELATPKALPGSAFGKPALLEFFEFLRKRRGLLTNLGRKKTAVLFCLDKDVDDLRRVLKKSPHVSYTEYCDIENYLFIHGDLAKAGASAAALDIELVRGSIGDPTAWRRSKAHAWKTWATFCLLSQLYDLRGPCTYGQRASLVNTDGFGDDHVPSVNAMLATLRVASGLSARDFGAALSRIVRRVNRIYAAGQWDRVFKGKWYSGWLARDLARVAGTRPINANGLDMRVRDGLVLTLDFNAEWTATLRGRLNTIVAMVS